MWQCLTPFLACGSLVFRSKNSFSNGLVGRVRQTLKKVLFSSRQVCCCYAYDGLVLVTNLWSYQSHRCAVSNHGTVRRQYVQPSPTPPCQPCRSFSSSTARTALTALGRETSRSAKSGKRGKTLPGLAGGTDWGHSLSQSWVCTSIFLPDL